MATLQHQLHRMALRVAPAWWSIARVPTLPQKEPKPDSQRIRRGHLEPGAPSIIGTLRHSVSHVDGCLRHRRVSFDPFPLHGPFHLKASFFFSFPPKPINHCLYVVACRRHYFPGEVQSQLASSLPSLLCPVHPANPSPPGNESFLVRISLIPRHARLSGFGG